MPQVGTLRGAGTRTDLSCPAMTNAPAPSAESPCVRHCCLDEDNVCMGCGRLLAEIVQWGRASEAQRAAILERSRERLRARGAR